MHWSAVIAFGAEEQASISKRFMSERGRLARIAFDNCSVAAGPSSWDRRHRVGIGAAVCTGAGGTPAVPGRLSVDIGPRVCVDAGGTPALRHDRFIDRGLFVRCCCVARCEQDIRGAR
jgi:hypothetical protein